MSVRVVFDVRKPGDHLVSVEQHFPATDSPDRTFRMAAWVPGSYKIRDFGRHVQDFEAEVGGKATKSSQTGKDAWTVEKTAGRVVTVRFRVYCRELTVDTSHVTNDHAHLFPATVVLYDDASRGLTHDVSVKAPRGWQTFSGLESDAFDGTLEPADDYDHLIDCPIELGPTSSYQIETFSLRGRKHRLVWWMAPDGMDAEALRKGVRDIVEATAQLFGGLPYKHYTFLTHVALGHGGGLEHRNSTVLGVDPLQLLAPEQIQGRWYPLVAHEFFHTWNVKRILPAKFRPYDLQSETYTGLLWLFEGFTTYYELPLMARAGVIDDKHWGKVAAEMLKYYEMARGRHHRSVSDCSRLTWTLLYQANEHNINRNVSYYTKGLFVALCLDAELRRRGVKEGLDVVMRYLWANHDSVEEDQFPSIVEAATGQDLSRLLANWTDGTSALPVDAAFKYLGWTVKREHPDEDKPLGLGVIFKPGTAKIQNIPEDSPSAKILQPDDELVAIQGYKWQTERIADWANFVEGDLELAVFREGRLRSLTVPTAELAKEKITIAPVKGDAAATRRRKAWLTRVQN